MKVNHGEDILFEMENIVNQIKTTSENSDPTNLIKKSLNKKVEEIKKRASLTIDPDYLAYLRKTRIIYSSEKINHVNEISKEFFYNFFFRKLLKEILKILNMILIIIKINYIL